MSHSNSPPPLEKAEVNALPPLQASKWLDHAMLLDAQEMVELIEALGTFYMYSVSGVTEQGQEGISQEVFLNAYKEYVTALKTGILPDESRYRQLLSSAWTLFPDHLRVIDVGGGRQLVRAIKPVVQVQLHRLDYSSHEGKFRSMTFGADQILWGVQFSFPQMYKDFATDEIIQSASLLPNYPLFSRLQRWVREHTVPTPFLVEERLINVSMRLGKRCFSWISHHPQLVAKNIGIKSRGVR